MLLGRLAKHLVEALVARPAQSAVLGRAGEAAAAPFVAVAEVSTADDAAAVAGREGFHRRAFPGRCGLSLCGDVMVPLGHDAEHAWPQVCETQGHAWGGGG